MGERAQSTPRSRQRTTNCKVEPEAHRRPECSWQDRKTLRGCSRIAIRESRVVGSNRYRRQQESRPASEKKEEWVAFGLWKGRKFVRAKKGQFVVCLIGWGLLVEEGTNRIRSSAVGTATFMASALIHYLFNSWILDEASTAVQPSSFQTLSIIHDLISC